MRQYFEIFRLLYKIGVKPKDLLGLGGDVVKMGKSLFNTRINPKLIQFIEKNQKIPTKILEEIKIHGRTLKNVTESQRKLFEANIRDVLNALKPKPPVTSVLKPATSIKKPGTGDVGIAIIKKFARKEKLKDNLKKGDKTLPTHEAAEDAAGGIAAQIQDMTGKTVSQLNKFIKSEKQLSKILKDWDIWNAHTGRAARLEAAYPTIKNTEKVTGKVIDFKGWTPTVIKGGKDKLATGGIAAHFRKKFDKGSDYGQFERRQAHNVAAGKDAMNVGGGDGDSRNNNPPIVTLHAGPTLEEIETKKKINEEANAKLALENRLRRKKNIEYYNENLKKEFDITPIAKGVDNAYHTYQTLQMLKGIKDLNPYGWLAGQALKKLTNYKK